MSLNGMLARVNAREEKILLRTDVPNCTLREVHLSTQRDWTHQEL